MWLLILAGIKVNLSQLVKCSWRIFHSNSKDMAKERNNWKRWINIATSNLQISHISSLSPGKCGFDFLRVSFKYMVVVIVMSISCVIVFNWMAQDFHDKSTSVQIMACGHQATSPFQNQCWPRSMSEYSTNKLQWIGNGFLSSLYFQK